MSNDLLSESVNNILDDVETTLCLPILILIVLCTLQFIIYDVVDIGCTVCQTIQNLGSSTDDGACVMNRVKGMIEDCARYIPGMKCESNKSHKCRTETRREDEWDLCDEDEDDCDC